MKKTVNKKNLVIREYPKEKNVEQMAARASNVGVYTVDSLIKTVHYFFEGDELVLATPNGYIMTSVDKAETICEELAEIIPMVRENEREGRKDSTERRRRNNYNTTSHPGFATGFYSSVIHHELAEDNVEHHGEWIAPSGGGSNDDQNYHW